jgi:hypothetical protein
MNTFDRQRLDAILELFRECRTISKEAIYKAGSIPDYDEAIAFLAAEGYLDESKYGFTITFKGISMLNNGDFFAHCKRNQREIRLELVGIIIGIAGLVMSIIALVK